MSQQTEARASGGVTRGSTRTKNQAWGCSAEQDKTYDDGPGGVCPAKPRVAPLGEEVKVFVEPEKTRDKWEKEAGLFAQFG